MKSHTRPSIRAVTTPSTTLVAICKKSLAKALVKHLDLPKWKRSPIRIVETGCMKLCPRRAVAVTTSREPGVVYVVPAGTPVAEVVARLSLTPCHPGERRDP
jgi:hypothetical protein